VSDELDFEELDAAVNDLLNNNDSDDEAARAKIVAVASQKHEKTAKSEKSEETEIIEKPAEAEKSARHFRGQFMDMVHPSSDVSVANKPNHAADLKPNVKKSESPVAEEELADEFAETPDQEQKLAAVFAPDDVSIEELEVDANVANVDVATEAEPEIKPETETRVETGKPADAYESPFLPAAKVEKRPLGTPTSVAKFLGQPEMPLLAADDGGKGEPEPELSESNFITAFIEEMKTAPKPAEKTDHLPRENAERAPARDTRAAIANTMIMPQYKTSETAKISAPSSPYAAAAAESNQPVKKAKHFPVIGWILIYLLLAVAGAALGAWLYLSGWLK
jgi:hypothetical protein